MSRPQHSKAVRQRLVPALVGLGAVAALSGCATGQQAETSQQVAAIYGASGDANTMAVRNATLSYPGGESVYPEGSNAPVETVLINSGEQQDKLVGVSSSYARSVEVSGTQRIPSGTRLYAVSDAADRTGVTAVEATSDDERETVRITLEGLTQGIRPGTTIPVEFTFAEAGSVTLQVPIGRSPEPRPEYGSPHGGGGTGTDGESDHSGGSDESSGSGESDSSHGSGESGESGDHSSESGDSDRSGNSSSDSNESGQDDETGESAGN
ncbi:Protein of unknown function [Actinopolyspora xinjiangensis]|uniref:Copper(I)-binding protein n=1 Tax=Actinopolyspora xinjiangensis TaxID=405564 RepID=A0A1H0PFZ4_9ACTN|nr:copper chaperone PCu(A)C [Actinopolyspora xinjiangensis]SDP04012.1 Protein of unknown function [Actinopolyspora xinjiangensis]